jgi:hypothetical protein
MLQIAYLTNQSANGPVTECVQCVCHDTQPRVISFSLGEERLGGDLRSKGRRVMTRPFVKETRGSKRLFAGPDHAGWLPREGATPLAVEAIR